MLFSRNTWIFVQFVLWMGYCTSFFHLHVLVWMISCLFVSYDKFLAMWLVSEFFRFSKVESVSTFFSPRLLLSIWYYCVIWCISGEKSRLVENRLYLKSSIKVFVSMVHSTVVGSVSIFARNFQLPSICIFFYASFSKFRNISKRLLSQVVWLVSVKKLFRTQLEKCFWPSAQ